MTYAEKLRDPRWQQKRLRVLDAHHWTCNECQAKDKTLHVHHGYYESRKDPWDYEDDTLHVFCEDCHAVIQKALTRVHRSIGAAPAWLLEQIHGYVEGLVWKSLGYNVEPDRPLRISGTWEWIEGAADALWQSVPGGISVEQIQDFGHYDDPRFQDTGAPPDAITRKTLDAAEGQNIRRWREKDEGAPIPNAHKLLPS